MDEKVRQRIKYLVEHGGVWPEEPAASRRCLLAVGAVLVVLELVGLAIQFA